MKVYNLRNSREDLDLKQKDIADILGVAKSTVSDWENGVHTIPLRRLIKYENHFGFSLDYLFGITRHNEEYLPLEIDLEVVATNLKRIRKDRKVTQEQVATKLNTSQSGYAHYENARYLILTSFLYNLYLIYGKPFSFDEILGRRKQEKY